MTLRKTRKETESGVGEIYMYVQSYVKNVGSKVVNTNMNGIASQSTA